VTRRGELDHLGDTTVWLDLAGGGTFGSGRGGPLLEPSRRSTFLRSGIRCRSTVSTMRHGLQYIAIPTVLVAGLIGAFLPRVIVSQADHAGRVLQLGTALAAGVFLTAGLVHLLPDALSQDPSLDEHYPFVFLATTLGFVLVLAIDLIAFIVVDADNNNNNPDISPLPTACGSPRSGSKLSSDMEGPMSDPLLTESSTLLPAHNCNVNELSCSRPRGMSSTSTRRRERSRYATMSTSHESLAVLGRTKSPWVVMSLLMALLVHSTIAGLALGASNQAVTAVFVAILAHKSLAGYALGMELLQSALSKSYQITLILLFSISTPLGIVIGLFAGISGSMALALIKAAAAGTFLYVGGNHLAGDLKASGSVSFMLGKIFLVLVGIGAMGVIALYD